MPIALALAAAVILICIFFAKLSNRIGVPVLLAFILLGMMFGSDGIFKIPFEDFHFAEQTCSVALIFIIFYGGYGTNWKEAKKVAPASILLSSAGVLLTALLTGLFCHFALRFSWLESLLIGAVLSSTDAASVFSILRSKKLNLRFGTASMLELESGANDPWAYMLTVIILGVMDGSRSTASILYLIFAQIFFGLLFGGLMAWVALWGFRHIKLDKSGLEAIFTVAVALLAYALPTLCSGNGYLSTYLVGIILGNTKIREKISMVHFFDGITSLMQILVFFLLGLLSFPSQLPLIILPSILIALFLTFVGRPVTIALLLTPFGCKLRQQALVAWSGLRGASSIIFAIMATVSDAYTKNDVFHIVFCIVLLSIGIQGTFLPLVSKKLGMIDNEENVLKTFNDYSEEEEEIQFLRFVIQEGHEWCGKKVSAISLPPTMRMALILRQQQKILPRGKTVIQPNDILILSALGCQLEEDIHLEEITIQEKSKMQNQRISEIDWKNRIVVMIWRNGKAILPRGSVCLQEKDRLILVSGQ